MTEITADHSAGAGTTGRSLLNVGERTRKRNAAEKRFRMMGLAAVAIGIFALVGLMASILSNGLSSFNQTYIALDVYLDPAKLDKNGNRAPEDLQKITTFTIQPLIKTAVQDMLDKRGFAAEGVNPNEAAALISGEAPAELRRFILANPDQIGETISFDLLASGRIDGYFKGRVTMESAALDRNISPEQLVLADRLKEAGILDLRFNWAFFTAPDASDTRPEAAGLGVAILGSAYMMMIVLALSLPIGVAASIYLEEFAPQNRWTDLIEVNIANLAAVPSIVFGILGLALFINFVGLPQSAPIVGALVLTLMTLPTIIIATRAALKAVPPSIRDAALGIGASKMQAIFHHVLPLAAPGILTGAIIGLAQALGETAPLLLIGMVAFVREYPAAPPEGFFDPAAALPVQVYNWTQRGDPAFIERASGAIIVLLIFLLVMNAIAILLRRRFERRW
ncbi:MULTISPECIES: phosphate ABC transporter permease PstA [Hoeflea]|uniref:Phosphate transport system permease protein PstA n=1 Tax=Hoeflea alexandrii TaxID=288436 RepID=A0ABT1CT55_9HYPH|nr:MULTISPECIES: phosphate ABC transporter permease PstA [Hoeflea]MCO6409383.1 phosphate ABC transporter permease PstA [Hoeflea alexandrii]MCY0151975.1 phosphate ABC transporter permease PstA [Hoeflea alexandrii]VVT26488.1 Phosphate transport system permease protein PstA [Hoeflea sp. EC-HK425]|tara:strand:- start:1487 stop:2842 length:1356 start_codon:yes stop_codon:yes gene_type:complete